ncbi:MAG: hypothetical protein EOM19_01070 [Candidatus Moranbacteria bacterium]|nr:hypothetical protein [Candidatus Moranbacteria bacterium]
MSKKINVKILLGIVIVLFSVFLLMEFSKKEANISLGISKNPDESVKSSMFENAGKILTLDENKKVVTLEIKNDSQEGDVIKKTLDLSQISIKKISSSNEATSPDLFAIQEIPFENLEIGKTLIFVYDENKDSGENIQALSATFSDEEIAFFQ